MLLAVESAARAALQLPPITLAAAPGVLQRLAAHRLHELISTGQPLAAWVQLQALSEGTWANVGRRGVLRVMPLRSRHAEMCYGLLVGYAAGAEGNTVTQSHAPLSAKSAQDQQPNGVAAGGGGGCGSTRAGHDIQQHTLGVQQPEHVVPLLGWTVR